MNTYRFLILVLIPLFYTNISIKAQQLTPAERESFIQKANTFRKQENFTTAIVQLDSILIHHPNDAGILIFKGDLKMQSKLFGDAIPIYKKVIQLNYEKTAATINLSYALFMNHEPANALHFAAQAWENDSSNISATINYFNAMLWNIKTSAAAAFLNQQASKLSPAQLLVLKARLFTTSGDYKNGLKYYDSLVKLFPDKYYVQEYAEVLLGKKDISQSAAAMKAHEQLFSANEYQQYKDKLDATKIQNAGTEFVFFKDVAKNTRIENSIWWQQKEAVTYRFRLSAGNAIYTSAAGDRTQSQFAHVAINERWNKTWTGETNLNLQRITPDNSGSFYGCTAKQSVQYQPNDRRMVGLTYSRDILNYTASLLNKNIHVNSLGYVTHILLDGHNGIFSQGSMGSISDGNQQMQFFGSLYHLFRTEPTIKSGLNFSALHYADNSIKTYFSPNKYLSTEIFGDYSSALPKTSKFSVQMQAAAGLQKIEDQNWQPSFRFQGELGYHIKHFETALKYQTSNVAAATGTGYKFNWFTLRMMYKW